MSFCKDDVVVVVVVPIAAVAAVVAVVAAVVGVVVKVAAILAFVQYRHSNPSTLVYKACWRLKLALNWIKSFNLWKIEAFVLIPVFMGLIMEEKENVAKMSLKLFSCMSWK